jgi:hypothetical protein
VALGQVRMVWAIPGNLHISPKISLLLAGLNICVLSKKFIEKIKNKVIEKCNQ